MVIALKLSVVFALLVNLICCVLNAVVGRRLDDPQFKKIRRFIKVTSYTLIIFQICSLHRFLSGQVEILCTLTMLALYLHLESVAFLILADYGRNDYRKMNILVAYNHVAVFLFALYLYVNYVMGFSDTFYSWADYYRSYQLHYVTFFTRAAIVVSIAICMVEFIINIIQARRERLTEYRRQGLEPDDSLRGLAITAAFCSLLAISQFVSSALFNTLVNVCIAAVCIYRTSYIVRTVHAESQGRADGQMSEVYIIIKQWLHAKPFPLQKSLTMDDIATATGVGREEFSSYIYNLQGMTYTAWVRDQRLEYCMHLLRSTDLTLSQIAYESGYGELAAMSKAFKKKYGQAPSAYRKSKMEQ